MEGQAQVRLVFAGELLEGHTLEQVKRRFGEAFKLEGDRLAAVFSGGRTVIKRSIGHDDGERYVAKLRKLGMRVLIEPIDGLPELKPLPAAAAAMAPAVSRPAPLEPSLVPLEEEVVCPNCSERQPKKFVLCRHCQTDIPRALENKREEADRARAERLAARQAERNGGRYAPPTAEVGDDAVVSSDDAPPFWGFRFSGRLGRINYLLSFYASMVLFGLIGIGGAVLIPLTRSAFAAILVLPLMLGVFVWGLRSSVLRLHDMNRAGWWVLIYLLPILPFLPSIMSGGRSVPGGTAMAMYLIFSVINFIMFVVMLVYPGTHGDNDFGGPARQGNGVLAIIATVLFAIVFIIYVNFAFKTYGDYTKRAKARQAPTSQQQDAGTQGGGAAPDTSRLPAGPAVQAFRDQYLSASNEKAFAVSGAGAYGFASGKISVREAMSAALSDCEQRREAYTSQCRIVNINGMSPKEQ